MTRNNNMRRGGRRNRQVVQVREDGDAGAARIDRAISHFRFQESAATILVKAQYDLTAQTTPNGYAITYTQIVATDDFASMATQFNTFKVKAMRFEAFHTNPTGIIPVAMSTVHGDFTGDPPSTWISDQSIIDAPDSQFLEPGSKKQTWYWNARGTAENQFQDVNTFTNYGGLRYYVRAAGSATYIASVIMTAEVVFRGRH
jgi:hypothetical protein